MNARLTVSGGLPVVLLASLLSLVTPIQAAPSRAKAPAKSTDATTVEIPQSVFVMPGNPSEGRDPFFPKSNHPYSHSQTTNPTPAAVELILNGLSGTAEHKLAMINGRTFAEGEKAEVTVANRRVAIQCIQINDDSVIVEIEGVRRELKLRGGI